MIATYGDTTENGKRKIHELLDLVADAWDRWDELPAVVGKYELGLKK